MKYIDVNLTDKRIGEYEIPEKWYNKFLGGRGIGLRILLEELSQNADPLGPENILVFTPGPLQGTKIAGTGRHAVLSNLRKPEV